MPDLTAREWEIFDLMGRGETNGEIAAKLGLSESTVKAHVGHVLVKIGVRNRAKPSDERMNSDSSVSDRRRCTVRVSGNLSLETTAGLRRISAAGRHHPFPTAVRC